MPSDQASISKLLGSELVSILVGEEKKEFNVHKKLICETSKFFNDAFNGPFKEGQENIMYMPEDDPEAFCYFVDWLYRNPLPLIQDKFWIPWKGVGIQIGGETESVGLPTEDQQEEQEAMLVKKEVQWSDKEVYDRKKAREVYFETQINRFLKLYFFAEKLIMDDLMNRSMDRIRSGLRSYDKFLGVQEIKQVYLNTSQGSSLRAFSAELLVFQLERLPENSLDQIATLLQEVPEIIIDVLRECQSTLSAKLLSVRIDRSNPDGYLDPRSRGDNANGTSCWFHKHAGSDSIWSCYADEDAKPYPRWPLPPCRCGSQQYGTGCACEDPHRNSSWGASNGGGSWFEY